MTNRPIDYQLDITSDVCPITFVKTKLMAERMSSGQIARVRLNSGEPLENVPRSLREEGHRILSLEPADGDPDGVYVLIFEKG